MPSCIILSRNDAILRLEYKRVTCNFRSCQTHKQNVSTPPAYNGTIPSASFVYLYIGLHRSLKIDLSIPPHLKLTVNPLSSRSERTVLITGTCRFPRSITHNKYKHSHTHRLKSSTYNLQRERLTRSNSEALMTCSYICDTPNLVIIFDLKNNSEFCIEPSIALSCSKIVKRQ